MVTLDKTPKKSTGYNICMYSIICIGMYINYDSHAPFVNGVKEVVHVLYALSHGTSLIEG